MLGSVLFFLVAMSALAQPMTAEPTSIRSSSSAIATADQLTPGQVDLVVQHIQQALADYPFPATGRAIIAQLTRHRRAYQSISNKNRFADELTQVMRAIGGDKHLAITVGEELGVRRNPTPAEQQHAHDFDRANAYGLRSVRRLPGNVGYIDLAYFSPDPDAGAALASAMRLVSGTDALIVDLRHNGGGSGETETTLASYFFANEVQLSGIVENIGGKRQERQHWTVPYLQGPHYLSKPIYVLVGPHTHSAAEVFAYDLKNLKIAKVVGQNTSGDATSSTGEINLGFGFSAFIPNGQVISPITHSNYFRVGVLPDVPATADGALSVAYAMALKESRSEVDSGDLRVEKSKALSDPNSSLTNG